MQKQNTRLLPLLYCLIAATVVIIGIFSSMHFLEINTIPFTYSSITRSLSLGYLLLLLPIITAANIFLRFLRWTFLLRAFGCIFKIKELFLAYLLAFIGNLFPFYFPYLLRLTPLKKKYYTGFLVLLIDLLIDFAAIAVLCVLITSAHFAAIVLCFTIFLALVTLLPSKGMGKKNSFVFLMISLCFALAFSILVWAATAGTLKIVLLAFGQDLPLITTINIFAQSHLKGIVSLIPAGIMTTGTTLIDLLQGHNISATIATYSVVLLRSLTFWFTILISIGASVFYYRYSAKHLQSSHRNHFDAIAEEYTEEIPEHLRAHFLEKKIAINRRFLESTKTLCGLDIGCGQGWYLDAMKKKGYQVVGIDFSRFQVENAARYSAGANKGVVCQGSITTIPLRDASLDFVYSINTFHHLATVHDQLRALDEIYRVLKTNGTCLIHEMNIKNPIFRFYMGYLFPLLKSIDAGTEIWIKGDEKNLFSSFSHIATVYQTFLPDFLPQFLFKPCRRLELFLEKLPLIQSFSAHICIVVRKQ